MKYYLYYDPQESIDYEIINDQIYDLSRVSGIVLCSSYINAETTAALDSLQTAYAGRTYVPDCAWRLELNNPESGGFIPVFEEGKRSIVEKCEFTKKDYPGWSDLLIGSPVDITTTLVAADNGNCIFTRDYHVCANALYMTVPYIYGITDDELSRLRGMRNFRLNHIEQVNRRMTILKNKTNL